MNNILALLQRFAAADKTVIVAAAVNAVIALVAGLGLHLSGSAVGIIAALVTAGLGWFTHQHFALKLAAKHAAEHSAL